MNAPASLFRKEVLERRGERLQGNVSIAVPLSWQIIGYTLLAGVVIAFFFLAFASYARMQFVPGVIVLDKGVATVSAVRSGVVTNVMVVEGQRVEAGTPLAEIRVAESLGGGGSAPARILAAIDTQDSEFADQLQQTSTAAGAERSRLAAQAGGLRQEIASLDRQSAVQQDLVRGAEEEVARVRTIAAQGFISRRDVLLREETLLMRRQQLAQLEQQRASKAASLAEALLEIERSDAQARAQAASVSSSRAELAQRRAQADADRGYVLTAPIGGRVTAITARRGQPADSDHPLMLVMPSSARLRAELYVPTAAAGFLAPGQEVRLAVDAFPYQTYGTFLGRIRTVSTAAISRPGPDGAAVPAYLVTADLDRSSVRAFGSNNPLRSGMTLSARIVTDRRTLLEWLFEPILAMGRP
jgi:membrane fusion protein